MNTAPAVFPRPRPCRPLAARLSVPETSILATPLAKSAENYLQQYKYATTRPTFSDLSRKIYQKVPAKAEI